MHFDNLSESKWRRQGLLIHRDRDQLPKLKSEQSIHFQLDWFLAFSISFWTVFEQVLKKDKIRNNLDW